MDADVTQERPPLRRTAGPPRGGVIDWSLPPRPYSVVDRCAGPGATRVEVALQFGSALVAAAVVVIAAVGNGWDWSLPQLVVAALLAFDLVGGVVTNASNSGKRWRHRPGQKWTAHAAFVVVHVHPFVVVWLFGDGEWLFAAVAYGYLLAAATLILAVPLYLRRPTALLLLGIGVLLAVYGPQAPQHLAWFLPLFYVKLLGGHLPPEEPYRPNRTHEPNGRATP